MTSVLFWTVTMLAGLGVVASAGNIALQSSNRSAQAEVAQRQQFVQQSLQLEGLYREIARALAELGARNNDEQVRALLQRHGITYTMNAAAAVPAAVNAVSNPARK